MGEVVFLFLQIFLSCPDALSGLGGGGGRPAASIRESLSPADRFAGRLTTKFPSGWPEMGIRAADFGRLVGVSFFKHSVTLKHAPDEFLHAMRLVVRVLDPQGAISPLFRSRAKNDRFTPTVCDYFRLTDEQRFKLIDILARLIKLRSKKAFLMTDAEILESLRQIQHSWDAVDAFIAVYEVALFLSKDGNRVADMHQNSQGHEADILLRTASGGLVEVEVKDHLRRHIKPEHGHQFRRLHRLLHNDDLADALVFVSGGATDELLAWYAKKFGIRFETFPSAYSP